MPLFRDGFRVCALLCLGEILAVPAHNASLWVLRGLYWFGEHMGITAVPPTPGASLGGQVVGYTFARPPLWWDFSAGVLRALVPLTPALAIVLWAQARAWRAPTRPRAISLWAAAGAGALAASIAYRSAGNWMMMWFLALGEWLGGTVVRAGVIAWGKGGPFSGQNWADAAGNRLVSHGPWMVSVILGALLAVSLHARLRRDVPPNVCGVCAYDRAGIAPDRACPECGTSPAGG